MNPHQRVLYRGKRFNVEEVYQRLPDGTDVARDVVRHPGAAVVLPLVDAEHVCLIYCFRPAVQSWLIELPAGTLEPNEPAAITAARELTEETGYVAGAIQHLHTFVMSPGILDERMHFYLATDLREGNPERETGEQIENLIYSWSEVDRLLRDGKILDAKTLVALLWYLRYRAYA